MSQKKLDVRRMTLNKKKINIPISNLSSKEIYALLDEIDTDYEEEIYNLMNDSDTEFLFFYIKFLYYF